MCTGKVQVPLLSSRFMYPTAYMPSPFGRLIGFSNRIWPQPSAWFSLNPQTCSPCGKWQLQSGSGGNFLSHPWFFSFIHLPPLPSYPVANPVDSTFRINLDSATSHPLLPLWPHRRLSPGLFQETPNWSPCLCPGPPTFCSQHSSWNNPFTV